jgi:hypothetical protein
MPVSNMLFLGSMASHGAEWWLTYLVAQYDLAETLEQTVVLRLPLAAYGCSVRYGDLIALGEGVSIARRAIGVFGVKAVELGGLWSCRCLHGCGRQVFRGL